MSTPRLTLRSVELRPVSIPLRRPVVSKVGRFDRWPLVVIDLHTEEGIVGRSYLEPYLERSRCETWFPPFATWQKCARADR
jgi:mandelate racemase